MWKEQTLLFSEKFYCIAVDLPGYGASELTQHAVTFESYVDSVFTYLKETAKGKPSIWCGLSMGGYLALRLYERAPELCRALILCDTKSGADGNEAKLKRAAGISQVFENREEFIAGQWKALTSDEAKKNTSLKSHFWRLVDRVSNHGIAAGLVALATRTDTTESLAKITVPTLIIVGQEDQVTPLKEAEALANGISGAHLKVIPKAGHLSNLENAPAFNEAVGDFLNGLR